MDEVKKTTICDADELPDIYTNSVGIHASTQDISINLYREAQSPDEDHLERRYLGRIRMTNAQAWVVSQLIIKGLKQLSKAHGLFLLPDNVLEKMDLKDEYAEFVKDL